MGYWISRGYRSMKRYREIAEILARYGFGFFVKKLSDKNLVPAYIIKKKSENLSLSTGQRIRLVCEELGPTFIKLGQIASTRSDIFSEEIIEELIKLQDNVTEVPFESLRGVFEEEFNITVEDAFLSFNKEPIAAASIGQVHRAVLLSGEKVIVKLQRPSIGKTIDTDISVILSMSTLFDEYFKDMIPFSMYDIMVELTTALKHETDYSKEGRNTDRFNENFKNDYSIYIPRVIWQYTSKKVLTQEYIEGIKVSEINKLNKKRWNSEKIADIGAKAFLKQVFIHGFFHGDLHPGNILVINEDKVALIDFGSCGYLDKATVDLITNMFIASSKKDVDKLVDLLMQVDAITDETNVSRLKEDLLFLMSHYYHIPLKKINMSQAISEFMRIIHDNTVKLPTQFTVLIKALITLEGTGRLLNPEFSISTIARDITGDILKSRFSLENLIDNISDFSEEIIYGLTILPKQIRSITKLIERNQIKIAIDEIEIVNFEKKIDRASSKISLSMIIAALIIGSSLTLNIKEGPKVLGLPIISFIGYAIACFLGIITLVSIFSSFFKNN